VSYDDWKPAAPDPGTVPEPDDRHDCDELCRMCPTCYVSDGAEICSLLCKHSDLARQRLIALELMD
jgi:hypothetical protein